MKIERLDTARVEALGGPAGTAAHVRALVPAGEGVADAVREILAGVRTRGDDAVREYTRRFDARATDDAGADSGAPGGGTHVAPTGGAAGAGVSGGGTHAVSTGGAADLSAPALAVPADQLDQALTRLDRSLVAGLQVAIANVALVADAGVGADVAVDLPQGQRITVREVPVQSAAVYVPGGRAPYPSTVVMGVVTARAAGVIDLAVCAPPARDGRVDPLILGACRLCGVERVYAMGGAQAIAALAYGTETVRPVDVIVGPGNLYVQEAKRQLSALVGIDGFAGPSDLAVVLGADADSRELELAALDMLAQAEHGTGSLVVAISTSPAQLDALAQSLERQILAYPTVADAACALIEAASPREAIGLANALAPEHLQLIGAEMEALATLVRSAGCLFVGAAAGTAFGDYVAGSNHVLPTGGSARFASTLSARHFRRRMAEVRLGPVGGDTVRKLAAAGVPIARAEGFQAHADSMQARATGDPRMADESATAGGPRAADDPAVAGGPRAADDPADAGDQTAADEPATAGDPRPSSSHTPRKLTP
ncbi:MAG TPA: histidinol dehydrogenase [Solirubrobacteraceae bacterium]|nr:histidinol dehydrogenase [Solirubrobacteraceae bacterium]